MPRRHCDRNQPTQRIRACLQECSLAIAQLQSNMARVSTLAPEAAGGGRDGGDLVSEAMVLWPHLRLLNHRCDACHSATSRAWQ